MDHFHGCIECEITDDYPCEKWGLCPKDEDFEEKLIEKLRQDNETAQKLG